MSQFFTQVKNSWFQEQKPEEESIVAEENLSDQTSSRIVQNNHQTGGATFSKQQLPFDHMTEVKSSNEGSANNTHRAISPQAKSPKSPGALFSE